MTLETLTAQPHEPEFNPLLNAFGRILVAGLFVSAAACFLMPYIFAPEGSDFQQRARFVGRVAMTAGEASARYIIPACAIATTMLVSSYIAVVGGAIAKLRNWRSLQREISGFAGLLIAAMMPGFFWTLYYCLTSAESRGMLAVMLPIISGILYFASKLASLRVSTDEDDLRENKKSLARLQKDIREWARHSSTKFITAVAACNVTTIGIFSYLVALLIDGRYPSPAGVLSSIIMAAVAGFMIVFEYYYHFTARARLDKFAAVLWTVVLCTTGITLVVGLLTLRLSAGIAALLIIILTLFSTRFPFLGPNDFRRNYSLRGAIYAWARRETEQQIAKKITTLRNLRKDIAETNLIGRPTQAAPDPEAETSGNTFVLAVAQIMRRKK